MDPNAGASCGPNPGANGVGLSPFLDLLGAVQSGNRDGAVKALAFGADPAEVNRSGLSIFHAACVSGNVEIVSLLLEGSRHKPAELLALVDSAAMTPLHYACSEGHDDVVAYLLSKGAALDATTIDYSFYVSRIPILVAGGRTPLHLAAERGEVDVIKLLLAAGARADARDLGGRTPFDHALLHRRTAAAQLLSAGIAAPVTPLTEEQILAERKKEICEIRDRLSKAPVEEARAREALIREKYKPLHPRLLSLHDEFFDPRFLQAARSDRDETRRSLMTEVSPGIFTFPLFTESFNTQLLEEAEAFEKSGLPITRPNSMNNYGIVFSDIGFGHMFLKLLYEYIRPFTAILFGAEKGASLNHLHAFLVRYKLGEDADLPRHVDSSHVTLNVCLGKEWAGGDLLFTGLQDTESEGREKFQLRHRRGVALLHSGRHYHEALPITSGERCNLIIWFSDKPSRAPATYLDDGIWTALSPGSTFAISRERRVLIWLHGLGGDGHSSSELLGTTPALSDWKLVLPDAPKRAYPLADGMILRAWYDPTVETPHLSGLETARDTIVEECIEREIKSGTRPENIAIGGFSLGGATALYAALTIRHRLLGVVALAASLPSLSPEESAVARQKHTLPVALCAGELDPALAKMTGARDALEEMGFRSVSMQLLPRVGHDVPVAAELEKELLQMQIRATRF